MSEQELKTLKRIATCVFAGIGWAFAVCEHNRAEKMKREMEEEKAKNSPWRQRVENKEDIGIGE